MFVASNIFGDLHFYRTVPWHHVRGVTDGLAVLGSRVVGYDVRGMDSSDRGVSDLSLEARVRDLEAVVTRLGFDRFALAGVDIGAATAVGYTARHARMVSHLVLLSPWMSGAEMFALPDLRVAAGAMTDGAWEWNVFTTVLTNVVATFDDAGPGQRVGRRDA